MKPIAVHIRYSLLQLIRQPSIIPRILVFVPLSEVLPFLLLGSAFLDGNQLDSFFYTNLVWGFIASTTMQCMIWFGMITRTSRFDIAIMSPGGLPAWIVGFTVAVSVLYLVSTGLACVILAFALGYQVQALSLLVVMVLVIPTSLAIVAIALSIELLYSRVFHLVNVGLDMLQVISCVLYPLSVIHSLLFPLAILSPVTWVNEFLRTASASSLAIGTLIMTGFIILSIGTVNRSLQRYQINGTTVK